MLLNTSESQLHTDVAWLQALPTAWLHLILTVLDPRVQESHMETQTK